MRELQGLEISNKKILVGLSGGIDSSNVASILLNDGYEVVGAYMKLHSVSPEYHKNNISNVDKVAKYLGIEYHVIDLEDDFNSNVYSYFVDSYINGITPNPCVVCNKTIKFGKLYEFAKSIGIDYLATGHYVKSDGKYIYQATDKSKDQSYFLAQINQDILPYIIFALGDKYKENIKKSIPQDSPMAKIAQNKESSEICFVQDTYLEVLKDFTDINRAGKVLDNSGNEVGTHKGYMHYTIGKRRGFDVPLAQTPRYVTSINPKDNTIVVGEKSSLKINYIKAINLNMFDELENFECSVKVRYRSYAQSAKVHIKDAQATIIFKELVYGVALGQYVVFYDKDRVIGSGEIISAKYKESIF